MKQADQRPIVLGITGASGAIYAVRALQWLLELEYSIHLVISPDGLTVIEQELGVASPRSLEGVAELIHHTTAKLSRTDSDGETVASPSLGIAGAIERGRLSLEPYNDYFSPIASGSYRTSAMVICPCSGTTLAAIAQANGRNLIHRAAEVHLKERRKLIVVPREAPLSLIQIENMLRITQAGAVVLPAAPGWYHGVSCLADLVDFIAGRILDQLEIDHSRVRRWDRGRS